jgi:hypothetical protein
MMYNVCLPSCVFFLMANQDLQSVAVQAAHGTRKATPVADKGLKGACFVEQHWCTVGGVQSSLRA